MNEFERGQWSRIRQWLEADGFTDNNWFDGEDAPMLPGVYVIVVPWYGVVYVGQSKSLAGRLTARHEVLTALRSRGYAIVGRFFKTVPADQLDAAERALIREFQPMFNRLGRDFSIRFSSLACEIGVSHE